MLISRRKLIKLSAPALLLAGSPGLARERFTLPKFNPLAFPAGRAPGFDPTHPAAKGCILCMVAFGASYLNTANGKVATGGFTSKIDSIGPAIVNSGSSNTAISGPVAPTSVVVAGIFRLGATLNSPGYLLCSSGTTGNNIGLATRSGEWQFQINGTLGPSLTSPLPVINTPYFVVFSNYNSVLNYVIVNLATGQTWSGSVTSEAMSANADTTVYLNSNSLNKPLGGPCAALALCYNNPLSLSQLLAWAARPWDFWYPPTETFWVNNPNVSRGPRVMMTR